MKARLDPADLRDRLVAPYRCTAGHEYPVRPSVSYDLVRKELTVIWPDGSRCHRFDEEIEQCRGQLEPAIVGHPAARRRWRVSAARVRAALRGTGKS